MSRQKDISEIITGLEGNPARKDQPLWILPMLATLAGERFFDAAWIYEPKLDGIRCLAFKRGLDVELYSRNRNILNPRYPELAEGLRRQPAERLIVDGEIVACDESRCSFEYLQGRYREGADATGRGSGIRIHYYIFDILYFEGFDITRAPLAGRKLLLEKALTFSDSVRYLDRISQAGEEHFLKACADGWEGLMAKRADSPYISGRSPYWLKFKCVNGQEFVIGGYTEPRGSRTGFGALLLGYYEGESLRYAGKVGTGFSARTLESLHARLARMERRSPPFDDDMRGVQAHWVKPELVAQVGFAAWTRDGRLRHPRFLGLRTDKEPGEVRRETVP